jgi:ubiquinone/menaquinone biosynthesis C-methylase UbiE
MMSEPDYKAIYDNQAAQYELLVAREDYQQNIVRALSQHAPLEGSAVVELGAGTGRLTSMLAPLAASIQAFDASAHMLDVAIAKLRQSGLHNWRVEVADHRKLPVADGLADIVIAGWTICYTVVWHPEAWRAELGAALSEMRRVARPGGTIIILETLGTGYETPHPPDSLADYYAALAAEGFASTWIRTDYRFASPAEAEMLTRFFFGTALAERMAAEVILPECTGIWWARV